MSPLALRDTPLTHKRRVGSAVVAVLAMVLTIGLQVFVAAPAPADIVQGTNGTMDISYNQVVNGDFISIGNGLLQCSGSNWWNGGTLAGPALGRRPVGRRRGAPLTPLPALSLGRRRHRFSPSTVGRTRQPRPSRAAPSHR